MKLIPSKLRNLAAAAVGIPLLLALLGQVAIWVIPGCNPNPYAPGECMVASFNVASILMWLLLGGLYLAVCLGVFVSAPLLLVAFGVSVARRRKPKDRPGPSVQ